MSSKNSYYRKLASATDSWRARAHWTPASEGRCTSGPATTQRERQAPALYQAVGALDDSAPSDDRWAPHKI